MIKKLRHPRRPQQGRLQTPDGVLVDSDERANTLADYLEGVQWIGEGTPLIKCRHRLRDPIVVDCGPIVGVEISRGEIENQKSRRRGRHFAGAF